MNRQITLLFFFIFSFLLVSFGQKEATIYGKIIDEYHQPIGQVYILVDSSANYATVSDKNGEFELKISPQKQQKLR